MFFIYTKKIRSASYYKEKKRTMLLVRRFSTLIVQPEQPRVYADNAATTHIHPIAKTAVMMAYDKYFANPSTRCAEGQQAKHALEQARHMVAHAIGSPNDGDIYFTSCGTESNNIVIRGVMAKHRKRNPRRTTIVISAVEHSSVKRTARMCPGCQVVEAPVNSDGYIIEAEFKKIIMSHRDDIGLVSIIMCQNETGTIQPIRRLADIVHENLPGDVPMHTDATQAIGKLNVDVVELGVDILTGSSHKFHGPRGVGILYARVGFVDDQCTPMTGGGQESGVRSGTENVPAIIGTAVAIDIMTNGQKLETTHARITRMRDKILNGLRTRINGLILNSDVDAGSPYILNVSLPNGAHAHDVVDNMEKMGVCVNSGSACTKGKIPSQTLIAMGRSADLAHSAIRISISDENSERDCDRIVSSMCSAYESVLLEMRAKKGPAVPSLV